MEKLKNEERSIGAKKNKKNKKIGFEKPKIQKTNKKGKTANKEQIKT